MLDTAEERTEKATKPVKKPFPWKLWILFLHLKCHKTINLLFPLDICQLRRIDLTHTTYNPLWHWYIPITINLKSGTCVYSVYPMYVMTPRYRILSPACAVTCAMSKKHLISFQENNALNNAMNNMLSLRSSSCTENCHLDFALWCSWINFWNRKMLSGG